MAVVLGNLALLIDAVSPRIAMMERKTRTPVALDFLLNLSRREHHNNANPYAVSKGLESDGESWITYNTSARGKANSKVNASDPNSGSSYEESNGIEKEGTRGESGELDWENQMKKRMSEIGDKKESEKINELRSHIQESESDGKQETEEEKTNRIRKELEKVAKEQEEMKKTATFMFELGQKAYEKGMYGRAVEFLEGALTIVSKWTLFGGEVQIWLAIAYEAENRHKDCIALYLELETGHPSFSVRRRAAELRYILQAPKLKISREEMVTIPVIGSSYDRYAVTWSDKYKDSDKGKKMAIGNEEILSSNDFLGDFLVWRLPVVLENDNPTSALWLAFILSVCLLGAAFFIPK